MAAAGVCPHARECDLAGCTLLQEQSVLRVEEKHREGSVEQASGGGVVEAMGVVFTAMAHNGVVFIH